MSDRFATSLRVYVEITDEKQVHDLAEQIADLLSESGYNAGDRLDAVIACMATTSDVEAWAQSPEHFLAALNDAGFVLMPSPKDEAA